MKLNSLTSGRVLKQIVPSVFFISISLFYTFIPDERLVNIVSGAFLLVLIGNIIWQNRIVSLVLGIIFLLGSCFFLMAINDNVFDSGFTFIDRKAALSYFIFLLLLVTSIVMSVLMILGFRK